MRQHRVSVALVAAVSTSLALLSPAVAQAESSKPGSSQPAASASATPGTQPADTPATAPSTEPSAGETPADANAISAEECKAQVEAAKKAHREKGGSSFVGPGEFAQGVINGYGSSGMPKLPECAQKPGDKKDDDPYKKPEFQLLNVPDSVIEAFTWIGAIMSGIAGMIQLVTVIAKFNPDVANMIRHQLKGLAR
ncbi:hypothetical protein [Corynebacterium lizhenjunii]|uniref:hypothetical protein n=1 Tax=Corynebacterium lizhenjunii TaxID=2709394 RepID=UPI0013EBBE5B|nr:hypothetical protein [Corynebacterium lizhenjunii]